MNEEITRQFELAKLDYSRLGTQEQALMNKRSEHWSKFFAILAIPGGAAGVVGLQGAIYLLILVPLFLTCIGLEIKHDEQVLRFDVRKRMKKLAAAWGFVNLDSYYSNQDGSRWWHGYYKYGRFVAFLIAQTIATVIVCWYLCNTSVFGIPVSLPLTLFNIFLTVFTVWCML